MRNNHRKINFYTQGQRFVARVLCIVWLLGSCSLESVLAKRQKAPGLFTIFKGGMIAAGAWLFSTGKTLQLLGGGFRAVPVSVHNSPDAVSGSTCQGSDHDQTCGTTSLGDRSLLAAIAPPPHPEVAASQPAQNKTTLQDLKDAKTQSDLEAVCYNFFLAQRALQIWYYLIPLINSEEQNIYVSVQLPSGYHHSHETLIKGVPLCLGLGLEGNTTKDKITYLALIGGKMRCIDINWTTYFPNLEELILKDNMHLQEFPKGVEDLQKLTLIDIEGTTNMDHSTLPQVLLDKQRNGTLSIIE